MSACAKTPHQQSTCILPWRIKTDVGRAKKGTFLPFEMCGERHRFNFCWSRYVITSHQKKSGFLFNASKKRGWSLRLVEGRFRKGRLTRVHFCQSFVRVSACGFGTGCMGRLFVRLPKKQWVSALFLLKEKRCYYIFVNWVFLLTCYWAFERMPDIVFFLFYLIYFFL